MVAWRTKVGLKCLLQAAPANEIDSVLETLSMGQFWLWGMSQSFVAFPKSGRDVYMHKYFEFEHSRVLQVLHAGLLISRSITSLNIFILIIFTADSLCNVGKHLLSTDQCNVLFCVKNEKKYANWVKCQQRKKTIITRSKFTRWDSKKISYDLDHFLVETVQFS